MVLKIADYNFRLGLLTQFKATLLLNEPDIYEAGDTDFNNIQEVVWLTEIGPILQELEFAINHLKDWMTPEKVNTNSFNFPSNSYIINEPIGRILILGCWTQPFQSCFIPLIHAIAAGNSVIIKPSEKAPHSSFIISKIVADVFDPTYVRCFEGDGPESLKFIMSQYKINHLFYTGNGLIGRQLYKFAADNFLPVTLSLNTICPCIVDKEADLKIAARRILSAKFLSAGQTCLAPNYILIHQQIYFKFKEVLLQEISKFFPQNPKGIIQCGKIIDNNNFIRLQKMLLGKKILYGGHSDKNNLHIEPTIIELTSEKDPLLYEEILGPILPLATFDFMEDGLDVLNKHHSCLAHYIFTQDSTQADLWAQKITSGFVGINSVMWPATNPNLPYTNKGLRGIGTYHGKFGFDTFSIKKSVMISKFIFDRKFLYQPLLGKLKLLKKLMK